VSPANQRSNIAEELAHAAEARRAAEALISLRCFATLPIGSRLDSSTFGQLRAPDGPPGERGRTLFPSRNVVCLRTSDR
jgi:hypothetical protein